MLGNKDYVDLILGDIYTHRTYYIGMVDETIRSISTTAWSAWSTRTAYAIGKYAASEYTDWIAEHVEPWTYLKFPYLKKVGWKGFVDGNGFGRVRGFAAVAPERLRRHGHPAGAGRIRTLLCHAGR